jgi:transcriptional regulator with XRE-family HTH domain
MSPKELRAFRESLGLSRREFAPKLFISEPTLERWERGQGSPRDVHLQILRRMREHLGAGHSIAYFQYDASSVAGAAVIQQKEKQTIVETLRGMGAFLLTEEEVSDGKDWCLSFSPGWDVGEPTQLTLLCEGSERPERPVIDFTVEITAKGEYAQMPSDKLQEICFHHGISWRMTSQRKGRLRIALRQRIFTTACNPETLRHVLGNFYSCWQRMKVVLRLPIADDIRPQGLSQTKEKRAVT